ncbi:MAG: CinA family protein [Thermomicrobia bacterium]|nr:CinA family protein [Thermomicrobia bacterium]MCA1725802.1 CinA family protein [Thermomicrobia bacterium]
MLYSLGMDTVRTLYGHTTDHPPTEDAIDAGIGALLAARRRTIATAESCTGGLVAARITGVSGSSAYFLGGIVSYSNDAKHRLLEVPNLLLERAGAVSVDVALAMARGVRRKIGTDIGIATTGIAGPTGATATKPVGLVYIALAADGVERCRRYLWHGDRLGNVTASAEAALRLVRAYLEELH